MVYSEAELKAVAEVCIEKDLLVISDEIYEKLVFGVPFASIATVARSCARNASS